MKKLMTSLSTIFMFLPWTIFLFRRNSWALESPAAEIIVGSYLVLMLLGGIFTLLWYIKGRVKNKMMQISLAVNMIYAVAAVFLAVNMIYTAIS